MLQPGLCRRHASRRLGLVAPGRVCLPLLRDAGPPAHRACRRLGGGSIPAGAQPAGPQGPAPVPGWHGSGADTERRGDTSVRASEPPSVRVAVRPTRTKRPTRMTDPVDSASRPSRPGRLGSGGGTGRQASGRGRRGGGRRAPGRGGWPRGTPPPAPPAHPSHPLRLSLESQLRVITCQTSESFIRVGSARPNHIRPI